MYRFGFDYEVFDNPESAIQNRLERDLDSNPRARRARDTSSSPQGHLTGFGLLALCELSSVCKPLSEFEMNCLP